MRIVKCLTKVELYCLLDAMLYDNIPSDETEEFAYILQDARLWDTECIVLNLFLSYYMKRKTNDTNLEFPFDRLNNVGSECFISFIDIDFKFIDFLFKHARDKSSDLDDNLLQLTESYINYVWP